MFGYDAVLNSGRRRPAVVRSWSEDHDLNRTDRRTLISKTRDLQRNMSIAAWAIRQHLDYVSTFSFQCRTGIPELDRRIEELIEWWSRPINCDVQRRHTLPRLVRLWEERRVIDGDVFIIKLGDGRLQTLEADRIGNPNSGVPDGIDLTKFVHGVEVSPAGIPLSIIASKRDRNRLEFLQQIRSKNWHQLGYFNRIDQIRGISPLASAINTFDDLYESNEYALAKAKVSQYFGLKLKRTGDADSIVTDTDGDGTPDSPAQVDFGKGPIVLDLDEDEDASILESQNPSDQFQNYMQMMSQAALRSLDIPYSFYDVSKTNYSGARQDLLHYELSSKAKRRDLQDLLSMLTVWRLQQFMDEGVLSLPEGMRMSDVRFEWIPVGIPWIDPLKETKAYETQVALNLKSRQTICKERGLDWHEEMAKLKEENELISSLGISPVEQSKEEDKDESDNDKND